MANIDSTKPNPHDTSNVVQDRQFGALARQPGVVCMGVFYEAEIESLSALYRIPVISPSPNGPSYKCVMEPVGRLYIWGREREELEEIT